VKSAGVYKCPDDPTQNNGNGPGGGPRVPCSYGFNHDLSGINFFSDPSISQLNAPASTVLLFEVQGSTAEVTNPNEADSLNGFGYAGNAGWLDNSDTTNYNNGANYATGPLGNPVFTDTTNNNPPDTTGRHTNAANYAFADGHAKYLRGVLVSPGYPAANPTNGQTGNVAAGTGGLSVNNANFAATFSPI
jgi:prepilin-type processing-associated H-X9-DG protein